MSRDTLNQAVILAGGLGTRLRPLTLDTPKPMVLINGKPFLEYLIDMLKAQGFTKVLLLLGYLAEKVEDYFKDGSDFGIKIEYSVSDVENDTGKRLKIAEEKIDPQFFLLYCDNYLPLNFTKMWQSYLSKDISAQITVYSNLDNYTKSNVIVDEQGYITSYDKTRQKENLQGVDLGFAIMKKEVLNYIPEGENISFEQVVYSKLIKEHKLGAYVTHHRYYSIGSLMRLESTEKFFKQKKTIFLDRDGVLNQKAPKAQYVKNWDEWHWLPGAIEAISLLNKKNYQVLIITNQAGIGRNEMSDGDLESLHNRMFQDIEQAGGKIEKIYHCPHDWEEGCVCRKPRPGLLFQAQKEYDLDLSQIYFIGDDERDAQAAESAGCKSILVDKDKNLLNIVKEIL